MLKSTMWGLILVSLADICYRICVLSILETCVIMRRVGCDLQKRSVRGPYIVPFESTAVPTILGAPLMKSCPSRTTDFGLISKTIVRVSDESLKSSMKSWRAGTSPRPFLLLNPPQSSSILLLLQLISTSRQCLKKLMTTKAGRLC
jgi:hypothetical protein